MNNRVVLAPRYNLRVEDFGDNHVLALECMSCGFKGYISTGTLRQNYKPYERIKLVEGDFKCDDCGRISHCVRRLLSVASNPKMPSKQGGLTEYGRSDGMSRLAALATAKGSNYLLRYQLMRQR